MILKRITKKLKAHNIRSCGCKKNRNQLCSKLKAFWKRLNGVDVYSYKCLFGNHYHIGHKTFYTEKKINMFKQCAKLTLLYKD